MAGVTEVLPGLNIPYTKVDGTAGQKNSQDCNQCPFNSCLHPELFSLQLKPEACRLIQNFRDSRFYGLVTDEYRCRLEASPDSLSKSSSILKMATRLHEYFAYFTVLDSIPTGQYLTSPYDTERICRDDQLKVELGQRLNRNPDGLLFRGDALVEVCEYSISGNLDGHRKRQQLKYFQSESFYLDLYRDRSSDWKTRLIGLLREACPDFAGDYISGGNDYFTRVMILEDSPTPNGVTCINKIGRVPIRYNQLIGLAQLIAAGVN